MFHQYILQVSGKERTDRKWRFWYFTKKQFLAYRDRLLKLFPDKPPVKVMGYFYLKTVRPELDENIIFPSAAEFLDFFDREDKSEIPAFLYHVCETEEEAKKQLKRRFVKGYVILDNNTAAAVCVRPYPFFLLLALLFALLFGRIFFSCNGPKMEDPKNPDFALEDGEPIADEGRDAVVETIDVPGFTDLALSLEEPDIMLQNPEGNTVYFVYTIVKDGKNLYKTDGIRPGEMVSVNLYRMLGEGTHDVTIFVSTKDVDTLAACSQSSQQIRVMCK